MGIVRRHCHEVVESQRRERVQMVNGWLKELHLPSDEGEVVKLGKESKRFDNQKGEMERTYSFEGGDDETFSIFWAHSVSI